MRRTKIILLLAGILSASYVLADESHRVYYDTGGPKAQTMDFYDGGGYARQLIPNFGLLNSGNDSQPYYDSSDSSGRQCPDLSAVTPSSQEETAAPLSSTLTDESSGNPQSEFNP